MQLLAKMYRPITALPFRNDEDYCEIAPCEALKPYIRCFWGTKHPHLLLSQPAETGIVIPDTCMDIIFNVNYTRNCYDGFFCALDERSYRTGGENASDVTATFAIRFYAWSAFLFADRDFRNSKNKGFCIGEFYREIKEALEPILFDIPSMQGKIAVAQKILLKRLNENRMNNSLMNAVYYMLCTCGRAKISDVCAYAAISERQLERIFDLHMGLTPKSISSLMRYQMLWQDMVYSKKFIGADAVEKYGYSDQAHLLNDFKKRHNMTPNEAIKYAAKR